MTMWRVSSVVLLVVLVSTVLSCPWTAISGTTMKDITVSPNHVWAVDRSNYVHRCVRPCSGNFIKDGIRLYQVDADDYEIFGLATNHYIYRKSVDGSGSWSRIGGLLKQISVSGYGYVWGVNRHNQVYSCKKPCRGTWVSRPARKLMQVEAGGDTVYGLDTSQNIYTRPVDGTGVWKKISGRMRYITTSSSMVYGIDRHHRFFKCVTPCTGRWKQVSFDGTHMLQCDATLKSLYAISTSGAIYRYDE